VSKLSHKSRPVKPKISIRGGRVVQAGYLTGSELQLGLALQAARLGVSVDDLHSCLTRITVHSIHAGPPPGGFTDDLVMAVHRQGSAPYCYRDL
jgi:hypothetical protein